MVRTFLLLCGLVVVSCGGGAMKLQSNPDGDADAGDAIVDGGLVEAGSEADVVDAIADGGLTEGGAEARTCTGTPMFFCLPGGCASDTGLSPDPYCLDGAWTCPYGTPSNTCSCRGADCYSQHPPPVDAAADSSADGSDAKASDAATDAPNDCRTFGCSSTQYCSQCLTVDQKVIYSCIPNGAAC